MQKENKAEISVLYVEDSEFDAFYYKSKLEKSDLSDFSVTVVETLAAAKIALKEKLRYDLVLLDLNLPDSSGLATLQSIFDEDVILPVVVLSASGDAEAFQKAREHGASGYLVKKADNYDVAEHIKMVVKKNRALIQRTEVATGGV